MEPTAVSLVATGIGVVSALSGVYLGQRMSRTGQREQWLMDERKEEFRELIVGLEESMRSEVEYAIYTSKYTDEERRLLSRKTSDFYTIVRTRIFTANEVKIIDVYERWREALDDHRSEGDIDVLRSRYEALLKDLVDAATAPLPKGKR